MTLSRGRDLLAIPGPSIIPDRVLNAMHRAAPNIYEGELIALTESVLADLRRVARTDGQGGALHRQRPCGLGGVDRQPPRARRQGAVSRHRALRARAGRRRRGRWASTSRSSTSASTTRSTPPASPSGWRPTAPARSAWSGVVQTDTASSVRNDVRDGTGGARRRRASGAPRRRLHREPRLRPLRDGRLGRRRDGRRLPEGADDPARPRDDLPRAEGRGGAGALPEPLLGLGAADGAGGLLPALLRDGADASPLRAAHGPRHDPRRGGARGGLAAARGLRAGDLGGGRGLGRGRRAAAQHRRPRPAQPCGDDDPHRARRRHAAPALVRRNRRADPRDRADAPGIDPDGVFRIGHMGHLNPPMVLGTLATIEAGLASLGIAHGAGRRRGGGGDCRRCREGRRRPTPARWQSSRDWSKLKTVRSSQ